MNLSCKISYSIGIFIVITTLRHRTPIVLHRPILKKLYIKLYEFMRQPIASSRENRNEPFGKSKIIAILQQVEAGLNRKEACVRYGISYSTLSEWFARYGSEKYQSEKKRFVSMQQKRFIVSAVTEGRMTKKEACLAHRITTHLLNKWIRHFKQSDEELTGANEPSMPVTNSSAASNVDTELKEARLKIKALETLIDIAEEQFKISIRKKPGAKQ